MLGFTFNGKHCSDYGICMKSKNRTLLPEPKVYMEEAMDMDGAYDFSASNAYGRVLYKNRDITVECAFVNDTHKKMRNAIRDIANWLTGEGRLIFDDEPQLYYNASVRERVDLSQSGKRGSFTLVFSCQPYACDMQKQSYTFTCTEPVHNFTVSNDYYATSPVIRMEGSFSGVMFTLGDKALKYNGESQGVLLIDCEKMTVTLDGVNVLPRMSGQFIEIPPNRNILSVTADSINATVNITYDIKYL